MELKVVKPDLYQRIFELHDQSDLILTDDKEILINFEEKVRYVLSDTISLGEQYFEDIYLLEIIDYLNIKYTHLGIK